jgi:hypothetical protein
MVAHGRVQNGVVVLEHGLQLPEDVEVTVLAPVASIHSTSGSNGHSVLDIPAVSVGGVLRPFNSDDDLLGEMLEGRG